MSFYLPDYKEEKSNLPDGLIFQEIHGDGHCLFHAVGMYLGRTAQELMTEAAL